jgi:hypothetical protein
VNGVTCRAILDELVHPRRNRLNRNDRETYYNLSIDLPALWGGVDGGDAG